MFLVSSFAGPGLPLHPRASMASPSTLSEVLPNQSVVLKLEAKLENPALENQ
jgi:hypothetical protein